MLQALECPKCSKKAIIQRNNELYQCLSCDFKRDFSRGERSSSDLDWSFLLMLLLSVFVVLLILP